MSDVIFCKTHYQDVGYFSYSDYFKLVELAGYPCIYVDELDPDSDNTYIFTPSNAETAQGWQSPKARIILWQMEWLTNVHTTPPGCSEVWSSDKWQADTHGFRYAPMGSDERLCEEGWKSRYLFGKNDVVQIAYQTPRRQNITKQLVDCGLSLAPNENLWGVLRSVNLMNSRAMLHVHQLDNMPGIAPLRWCLAAAHHLPMISETVNNRGIFGYTHMVSADYAHLAEFTAHMLKEPSMLRDYAAALNGLLCHDMTFRKSVERML